MSSVSTTPVTNGALTLGKSRKFAIWATFSGLCALSRSRKALGDLTDAQLEDIGISPDVAHKEAQRPVWDVPAHWLR